MTDLAKSSALFDAPEPSYVLDFLLALQRGEEVKTVHTRLDDRIKAFWDG
jgi:hypothetical protein